MDISTLKTPYYGNGIYCLFREKKFMLKYTLIWGNLGFNLIEYFLFGGVQYMYKIHYMYYNECSLIIYISNFALRLITFRGMEQTFNYCILYFLNYVISVSELVLSKYNYYVHRTREIHFCIP